MDHNPNLGDTALMIYLNWMSTHVGAAEIRRPLVVQYGTEKPPPSFRPKPGLKFGPGVDPGT